MSSILWPNTLHEAVLALYRDPIGIAALLLLIGIVGAAVMTGGRHE